MLSATLSISGMESSNGFYCADYDYHAQRTTTADTMGWKIKVIAQDLLGSAALCNWYLRNGV